MSRSQEIERVPPPVVHPMRASGQPGVKRVLFLPPKRRPGASGLSDPHLLVERDGHVVTVTMNRPRSRILSTFATVTLIRSTLNAAANASADS